jgi:eukaryotic-like serine/threonine-protein kinase
MVAVGARLIGERLGGRYEITGKLGDGGVAIVYDALDVSIRRPVAIKVLLAEHRMLEDVKQRLLREGYLSALLVHPHICNVSEIGTLPDGSPFLVMDRLIGSTVAERLVKTGPLSLVTAVTFAEQILSVLCVAHGCGIVHRDIKPGNVFMATVPGLSPIAKLLDFGAAICPSELLPSDSRAPVVQSQLTAVGSVIGTPHYLAPEQASGLRDIDARTDIYQVGVFLYEALSGQRPCAGETYSELVNNIAQGNVKPLHDHLPQLPPPVAAVVARAMATRRENRFQSAEQMLEALRSTRYPFEPRNEAWEPTTQLARPPVVDPVQPPATQPLTEPMLPRNRMR